MTQLLIAVIYLSFISLGLPDSVLGSAWPTMYEGFDVPLSYGGIVSMITAFGTIVSSLLSDRLTKRFGTGIITAVSVATTAVSLMGFSFSNSFWLLCLWAIPYGLGAGSVDASLNNYVALHYASRHMSWLHCMWGVGTIIGPNIMGYVLTGGSKWNEGYFYLSLIQAAVAAVLIFGIPLWKKSSTPNAVQKAKALSLKEIFAIRGAKSVMLAFFCYCGFEQTAMLWASSYMVLHCGMSSEKAASFASIFFIGITVGRLLNGFLTFKLTDRQMIRTGEFIGVIGCLILFLPFGVVSGTVGIVLIGLGCAPIYPCIIHSTPECFGEENSQAVIGVQMASAYVGILLMPPLFGLIANHIGVTLMPVYLLIIAAVMIVSYETLIKKTS